jgi:hypothetical protein
MPEIYPPAHETVIGTTDSSATQRTIAGFSLALALVLVLLAARATRAERLSRSMEQAQVLLCVAGALTMLIIGNSLARAFGIAGAASIIRFRIPVDDPRVLTILFLLMALGMATGLGATGVSLAGTLFVCVCLLRLKQPKVEIPRTLSMLMVAQEADFPAAHVSRIFAHHSIIAEPIEISREERASVRYRVSCPQRTALEDVNAQLMAGHLRSVAWQASKKDRAA